MDAGTPMRLALGATHSCALMTTGDVYCWGSNYYGQLGAGTPQPTCDITDAGGYPAPQGGASLCSPTPVKVAGLPNPVVSIVAGEEHTCALDNQRIAYCWGTDGDGQLGDNNGTAAGVALQAQPVPNPADPQLPMLFDEIAAGDVKTCGRQGTNWYCWGGRYLGTETADGSMPNNAVPSLVNFP